MTYENGGGAFLVPYFIALAMAGIPILILEYSIGNRYRGAGSFSFRTLAPVGVAWLVAGRRLVHHHYFYMVIVGWVLSYTYYSFGTQWGSDTEAFFNGEYLGISDGFWNVDGIQLKVLITLLISWGIVYWLLRRGVSRESSSPVGS